MKFAGLLRDRDEERLTPDSGLKPFVVKPYIAIARPEHWIKNVFMLFGTIIALVIYPRYLTVNTLSSILIGLAATCLIASSNYVLNEIIDAPRDAQHPEKRSRPVPSGLVSLPIAYFEWVMLACLGLFLAWMVNLPFFLSGLGLWVMGIIYNVPPIRSKEAPIVDVLSEALTNPIRFLMGWYAVANLPFPPSSMIIAYWMLGCFLMAAKRLAEYREINDAALAAAYRHSFSWYTEDRLVISMIAYVSGFMFFFAVVMTKYHPELILSAPFLMILMGYIAKLTFLPRSIVQHPERLLKQPAFIMYSLGCAAMLFALSAISIPGIRTLLGLAGHAW
jgi:4-hydroxybenzoate polyprenyltransferase